MMKLNNDSSTTVGTSTSCSYDDARSEDGLQLVIDAAGRGSKGDDDSEGEAAMVKDSDTEFTVAMADYGITITEQRQKARIVVTCPLTQQPLKDPVVNPVDGVSYERSAIVNQEDEDLYYPNRTLKEYIEATTSAASTCEGNNVLDLFLCPITQDLMRDPVIDSEGNTYERSAVVNWIQKHGVSPITRNPLTVKQLYDNTTLLWVMVQELQPCDDHDHDSVQEWRESLSSSRGGTTSLPLDGAKRIRQPSRLLLQQQHGQLSVSNYLVDLEGATRTRDVNSRANHHLDDEVQDTRRIRDEEQKRQERLHRARKAFLCFHVLFIAVAFLVSYFQQDWLFFVVVFSIYWVTGLCYGVWVTISN